MSGMSVYRGCTTCGCRRGFGGTEEAMPKHWDFCPACGDELHDITTNRHVAPPPNGFALFRGEYYYPLGGWDDLEGVYATVKEAQSAKPTHRYEWWQIVDLETRLIVERGDNP